MTTNDEASESPPRPERRTLRLAEITLDKRFQARKSIDLDTVKDYADKYQHGVVFPALEGVEIDGTVYLIEGWHRYNALSRIGRYSCDIDVTVGSVALAHARAAISNATHGLPRKKGDSPIVIRQAVETIGTMTDDEWSAWKAEKAERSTYGGKFVDGWSYTDLARLTGYSHNVVSNNLEEALRDLDIPISQRFRKRRATVSLSHDGDDDARLDPIVSVELRWPPAEAMEPQVLLRLVDEDTGEAVGEIRDQNIAEQAQTVANSLVDKALREQQTRGMQLTEVEHDARIRVHALLQVESALHRLYAVQPEDMAVAWEVDRPDEDFATLLDTLTARFVEYAVAAKAAEQPRLRAVK